MGGISSAKQKNALAVLYRKGLISLERETGFEPATFSLGSGERQNHPLYTTSDLMYISLVNQGIIDFSLSMHVTLASRNLVTIYDRRSQFGRKN